MVRPLSLFSGLVGVAHRLSLLKFPVQCSHAYTRGVYKTRASRSRSQVDTGVTGGVVLWKKPFPRLHLLCRICFSLSITSVCLLAAKGSRVWGECGQRRPASGTWIFWGYWSCLISRTYNGRGIEIRCQRHCLLMWESMLCFIQLESQVSGQLEWRFSSLQLFLSGMKLYKKLYLLSRTKI